LDLLDRGEYSEAERKEAIERLKINAKSKDEHSRKIAFAAIEALSGL